MKKVLVAYFSASGETARLAKTIADVTGGKLYEIQPKQPYTSADLNWNDKNSRTTKEMNDPDSRPEISGSVENMADYDIVFIGFPIWWGETPRIMSTFMESYDFSGKTVVSFSTSGGSGMGKTDSILHECCAESTSWRPGKRLTSRESKDSVQSWISSLNI